MQIKDKDRQKLLIIATVVVVGLLVADKLVLTPLLDSWKSRSEHIESMTRQVAQGRALVQRGLGIRNHWKQMQERALTNDTSVAEQQVFRAISGWAEQTGVTINAITPQWKRDSDDYGTYQCRIDANGDLDQLCRFIHAAEREPMALRMESIELASRDKEGQQLSLGLQVSALVFNPQAK